MYIVDVLKDTHLDFKEGDNIIISSQTGSGKTQYVYQKLLPDAVREGKKVVYYCNRLTLYDQNKNDIKNNLKKAGITDPEFLKDCLDNIHIRTYQEAEIHNELLCQRERIELESADGYQYHKITDRYIYTASNVKYYVFDEAHYFISDTLFNSRTNLWAKIVDSKHEGVFVFLTATPEPLFCLLNHEKFKMENLRSELFEAYDSNIVVHPTYNAAKREAKFVSNKDEVIQQINDVFEKIFTAFKEELNIIKERHKSCLTIPFDYSYLRAYYFKNIWSIISKIKNSDNNEKWLIFVDDKVLGQQIYTELCEAVGEKEIDGKVKNIAYINADIIHTNKDNASAAHKQVYSNSKFNYKVLITTSVLDCGVNLLDDYLKNVVVLSPDKTSFIQMIGRIRRSKDRKLNLYIQSYSFHSINSKLLHVKGDMKAYSRICALHEYDSKLMPDPDAIGGYHEKITPNSDFEEAKEIVSTLNNLKSKSKIYKLTATRKKTAKDMYLISIKGNILAWLNLLYSFYIYQNAINSYNESPDTFFFLQQQLKWIDQTYDETHWIDDAEAQKTISAYLCELAQNREKLPLSKQKELSYFCVEFLMKYHIPPKHIKNNISRYRKENTYPKKAALNKAFIDASVDYHIESYYDRKNKVNYWIVKNGYLKLTK